MATIDFRTTAFKIEQLGKQVGVEVPSGLRVIGESIMTDVKASSPGHGVPVDTGALRGSGRVEGPVKKQGEPSVILSFGGAAAPYAVVQHEVTSFQHTVGEARYLVRGVERFAAKGLAAAPEAMAAMVAAATRAIKRARLKGGR